MAERDPANLNAVEEVQIVELADASRKAKRKKMFAALAGGVALIGGSYYAYELGISGQDEPIFVYAQSRQDVPADGLVGLGWPPESAILLGDQVPA